MLNNATPYPQQGSYCLYEDPAAAPAERHPQLARIIRWNDDRCLISLPLVDGASGNRMVDRGDLKDATPLTLEEQREMVDLDRQTRGSDCRSRRLKQALARHDALKSRLIWSGCMQRHLDRLNSTQRAKAA